MFLILQPNKCHTILLISLREGPQADAWHTSFFLYALLYLNYMFAFDAFPLEVFCSFAEILSCVKRFQNGTSIQDLQAIPQKSI